MSQADVFIATSCITTVQQIGNMLMVSHQELAGKKNPTQIHCTVRLYCFSPSHIHYNQASVSHLVRTIDETAEFAPAFLTHLSQTLFPLQQRSSCCIQSGAAPNHMNYIHPIPCLTYIKPRTT